MKYLPIDKTLFINNRKNLVKSLKPGSIAVFNSNDIMPTSADGCFPFMQNTDIFYLSGIDQEESILVIFPDAKEEKNREILFVRESGKETIIWEGHKYTKEEAGDISGIKAVRFIHEFEGIFKSLVFECDHIYLNTNEHIRAQDMVETRDMRFVKWCMEKFPLHRYERLAPIMHHLRAVKSPAEVALIQQAVEITKKAFYRLLKFVKPGVWEYEIEAEILHEFIKNRSNGPAFSSIVASGKNTCILHYVKNDQQCKDGDLLLTDLGAQYALYASDVTRTIPVGGCFNKRQKEVYNAVLRVQKGAIQMLKPGNTLLQYNKDVGVLMEKELINLGLIDAKEVNGQPEDKPLYKKYFMHGSSHHMGLDPHDFGNRYRKFEPGMVFTCEPGIYIQKEAIGIRLENDILITKDNPIDLTREIPIEADEIEDLMNAV